MASNESQKRYVVQGGNAPVQTGFFDLSRSLVKQTLRFFSEKDKHQPNTCRGFSMVEILVASGIFVTAVTVFMFSFGFLEDLSGRASEKTQAALLLEEGSEAVLLLRDSGWEENIAILEEEQSYSLYWNGSSYQTAEGDISVGDYLRTITVFPAHRDGSDSYASSGTSDPGTKRVLIEISRAEDGELLASAEMLVHNSYE